MAKKYKKKFLNLKELRYLEAFIEWKNLSDEFAYFEKHAFEKTDENLPFSRLTL